MSYTRSFQKLIRIPYSGTVSDGQTTLRYDGTAEEYVTVNVFVDTDDFDSSAAACGNHVNALTASVVATEAKQTESIHENNRKISQAIIGGFFKTVRSELGQQIATLKSQVDATLLHLNALAARCREKRQQMETDYGRITERYSKIFSDLNKELQNRVFELDKAAFRLRESTGECAARALGSDLVGIAAVTAAENARVQSSLLASVAKKRAFDAINAANAYLTCQNRDRETIDRVLLPTDNARRLFVPVCLAEETDQENPQVSRSVLHKPDVVPNSLRRRMTSELKKAQWKSPDAAQSERIRQDYSRQVAREFPTDSAHDRRIRNYLNQFINNPILSL